MSTFENKAIIAAAGLWLLWVLGSVSVVIGVAYAAFHFISKFW